MSEKAVGELLVLVLDINPNQLLFVRQPGSLTTWLDAVLAFANSHLMLHPSNTLAAIASHSSSCSFLYPKPEGESDDQVLRQRDGQYEMFYQVESTIRERVADILKRDCKTDAAAQSDSLLSGALCLALSYIHRREREMSVDQKLQSRILVMSSSGDTAAQYMNFMNVFFTAQKQSILIDACMLNQDSGLLQQGADITGGLYLKVKEIGSLLQYLIWVFLPDARLRESLGLPAAARVDYRAACFCHRQLVDIGFVCSVCLSIFCKFSPICTTCHAVFKTPGPPLGKFKKKRAI